MKLFRFKHQQQHSLITPEGEIQISADNTSVISDTLAALLGENNFGEVIEDMSQDSDNGEKNNGEGSELKKEQANSIRIELLKKTVVELKQMAEEYEVNLGDATTKAQIVDKMLSSAAFIND